MLSGGGQFFLDPGCRFSNGQDLGLSKSNVRSNTEGHVRMSPLLFSLAVKTAVYAFGMRIRIDLRIVSVIIWSACGV